MSTADPKLDPTAKTQNHDLTPQQKIDGTSESPFILKTQSTQTDLDY
jgi:hypothetical protein